MKGVRQLPNGKWQVFAKRDGKFKSKVFAATTSADTLRRERDKLIGRLVDPEAYRDDDGPTLAHDAPDYLALITHMPSYSDRAYHIGQWVDALGFHVRRRITKRQIQTVLEAWRKTGAADGGPLSPGSLNRRRAALMHLFTTLDGKSHPNVVKDVPAYDERASHQIRALPLVTVARLISHVRASSQTRARLHVLMWTGWPASLVKALKPADIDWERGRVRVARRKKGKGMPAAWVPVVPRAMIALRRFAERTCWGEFSHKAIHASLQLAAKKENAIRATKNLPPLEKVYPYMLKHSFATWAAGVLHDDRALKELLRTNSIQRYTEGALADRLEQARGELTNAHRRGLRTQLPQPSGAT